MAVLALVGGTIYVDPRSSPIVDGVMLIEGGAILTVGDRPSIDIPAGTRMIDCTGHTIVAGFWNCHVHLTERKWSDAASMPTRELQTELHDFTRYGFTSVFDLSSLHSNTQAIAQRIESGDVDGPRILTTGPGLVPPGAAPAASVTRTMGWMDVSLPEAAGPAQAAAAAQSLLEDGVDGVKLFLSGAPSAPPVSFSAESIAAAVKRAQSAGKAVFVHPNNEDDWQRAIEAGAGVIAHTVPSARDPQPLLAAMRERGISLIPTLRLWKHLVRHERSSVRERMVGSAVWQLAVFHSLGGRILFGTDYGAVDADPTEEYLLMQHAGLDFADILTSLTTAPARRFSPDQNAGTLLPGQPADVAVLRGRPADGPDFFSDVVFTLCSGRLIYSAR